MTAALQASDLILHSGQGRAYLSFVNVCATERYLQDLQANF